MRTIGYSDVPLPQFPPYRNPGKDPKRPPSKEWETECDLEDRLEELKRLPKPPCEKKGK